MKQGAKKWVIAPPIHPSIHHLVGGITHSSPRHRLAKGLFTKFFAL
jgi:hypothetical protein